jgi:hypothetical protein
MDRSLIDTYVEVARLLSLGVPALTLVQQLEVAASTSSPNRNCHSKDYRSMVFQAQSIYNSLMDRTMIGTYVDDRYIRQYRSISSSLLEQLEVSASTGSPSQIVIPKAIAQWLFKPNQYAIASWIGR